VFSKVSLLRNLLGKLFILGLYVVIFATFLYVPTIIEFFWPSKTINVCVFAETFCPAAIKAFEEKTGIAVNLTYAEIDEQVYAKFRVNEGEGYDVIGISDYMVNILSSQNMLQPLDHNTIPNKSQCDQRLMNRNFDKANRYSMPHKWYTYGIVYDREFFNIPPNEVSLRIIFTSPEELLAQGVVSSPFRLCMLDDGRDATFMTAIYLFGRVDGLSDSEYNNIQQVLIKQKKWVEAYTVHSAQYFLTAGVVPIALMSSNYMHKLLTNTDRFTFAIPKEGSMLIIENLAIPRCSTKVQLAQQFINFMLSDEIALLNSKAYGYNSANKQANMAVSSAYVLNPHLVPDDATFDRLFIPLLPAPMRKIVEDLWLAVSFA